MSLRTVVHAARSLSTQPFKGHVRRCARRYATTAPSSTIPALKPSAYGQPLYPSHPHLMKPGEITPGIPAEEYERRRRALMDSLPDKSLVVCVAGQVKYMSGKIFYKFRQASDFWYLTGFAEPASALVLEKAPSVPRGYRMTLFSAGTDPAAAQWDGARMSHADVVHHLGADDAQPVDALPAALRALAPRFDRVYLDLPPSASPRRGRPSSPKSLLKYLAPDALSRTDYDVLLDAFSSSKRKPLAPEVGRLRSIKSEAEQRVMRAAADISARAHAKTMRFAQPDMSEHVIAAHFEYLCAREGSLRPAYVPVVASGANALTIHYTANDQLVRDGELILMDAACEYNGYASDITRTFPASGTFTPPQAALYGAVLAAQKALVALCSAAAGHSLAQLHRASCDLLRAELARAGLPCPASGALAELYPHYVGHPVGIDLHESSHFERNEPIKAGMVITIEPGIYVPPSPSYPTHFHNIGIRIEDEVLVGEEHPIVLSVNAPKEIVDVEGACQGQLGLEPL
ncbi:peptidase M24, structural domain-containing protein [Sparassis latifolia]